MCWAYELQEQGRTATSAVMSTNQVNLDSYWVVRLPRPARAAAVRALVLICERPLLPGLS